MPAMRATPPFSVWPNGEWGYSTRCQMLGPERPEAMLPDRALYLPTFSHLLINIPGAEGLLLLLSSRGPSRPRFSQGPFYRRGAINCGCLRPPAEAREGRGEGLPSEGRGPKRMEFFACV